ncbi:hypothetical protein [Novosphingobium sp. TCA1]|uniref:hypothetical protein n=1 Tax=Novosphingobium sp. TCA1 TaxID=2682474 RepID=UPI00130C1856|nr:hypothetical protein [Novosphingobium sp. TCA1]GFE76232.1 hypothetical protein NTCA1_38810 [Novosphingobium sp. TCA1]
MRDFLAGFTLVACVVTLAVSIIALVKPMPRLGMGTRKQTLRGFLAALGLFVVTLIVIPAPSDEKRVPVATADAIAPKSAPSASGKPSGGPVLSEEQDYAVTLARLVVMQTINCQGDVDLTQEKINKVAEGRAQPIDAYDEAKRGEKACKGTVDELMRADLFEDIPAPQRASAKAAVTACTDSARSRVAAMALAQKILDGDHSLGSMSLYRELRSTGKSDELDCRNRLLDFTANMHIPETEVEFVHP